MNSALKNKLMGAAIAVLILIGGMAVADFYGDLRRVGIEQDPYSASAPGFIIDGSELWGTASSVSLTSPTATWAIPTGARLISLTSDANLTGSYPTGGATGQVITIITGAGSNTIRFDDGANTILGGNITLTEGQSDVLTLYNNGSAWVGISAHDN